MSGPLRLSAAPPPVLLLRLPAQVLDLLATNPALPLAIQFAPDANVRPARPLLHLTSPQQLLVDGRPVGFTTVREELPHDVLCRAASDENYTQVGSVVQRLTVERQLDGGVRERVRGLGAEAERKRREHHSALLDENGKAAAARPAKRKADAPAPPALQAPRPRLVEIPAAPQLSADDVRARVVHLLALRSQNDLALRASCRAARAADVTAALGAVATTDASGLYALRDDVLLSDEVQPDAWPLYAPDERAQVRLRVERARAEAPVRTAEEYVAARRRFEAEYARYKALHEQLEENKRHFEALAREWEGAGESSARHAVAQRVEADYAERAARVTQAKADYRALHQHLTALKQRMRAYLVAHAK